MILSRSHLKRGLANERMSALLILANLAESNSTGAETVGTVKRNNVRNYPNTLVCSWLTTYVLTPPAVGASLRAAKEVGIKER